MLGEVAPALKPRTAHQRPGFSLSGGEHLMVDTGGAQRHPVSTEKLMNYWAHGAGAAKIQWGTDGDFDRCVLELGKHVGPDRVKGLCSNLHVKATGARPGHAPGEQGH